MATSLEGFSVTSHEERVARAPFKGIKGYERHPPALKPKGPIEVVHNREVKIAARQF